MSISASQGAQSVQIRQKNAIDIGLLRSTLATLGYHDLVPMAATPMVTNLVNDLLRTTESFKEAKEQIADLLEQKKIWELGNETFKCESTRLLAECNELHKQMLTEREDFEQQLSELSIQLQHLSTENKGLRESVDLLNTQLKHQQGECVKFAWANQKVKDKHSKPPFITAVRSQTSQLELHSGSTRCTCAVCKDKVERKKSKDYCEKLHGISNVTKSVTNSIAASQETHCYEKLEKRLERYINKVNARDREIERLQELLAKDGRPMSALYMECCYKDIKTLQEDVSSLQKEKTQLSLKIIESESKLHEAMQTALSVKVSNTALETELQKMRQVALDIENEANSLIDNYERDINKLRKQLLEVEEEKQSYLDNVPCCSKHIRKLKNKSIVDIAILKDHRQDCKKHEALHQKVHKLKSQLKALEHKTVPTNAEVPEKEEPVKQQESLKEQASGKLSLEDELKALKALCTQYRHHYMRHVAIEKENEYLKVYIKGKEEEIAYLRQQLELRNNANCTHAADNCVQLSHNTSNTPMDNIVTLADTRENSPRTNMADAEAMSVQATLKRLTIERDLATAELKRLQQYMKEFQARATKTELEHADEVFKLKENIELLKMNITAVENKSRYWLDATQPCYNTIVLMKEERNIMEQNCKALEKAIENLTAENEQLRKLTKNTTTSLEQSENKFTSLSARLNTEQGHVTEEMSKLMATIEQLTAYNAKLQKQCHKFENEAKEQAKLACKYQRNKKDYFSRMVDCEEKVARAQEYIERVHNKKKVIQATCQENCIQNRVLREQISILTINQNKAGSENSRLSDELEVKHKEIKIYAEKYQQSKREIERLTNQLTKYMEEVKKAQDLLGAKEKERSELLEYYRNLSNEQSALETNNQSLEQEAETYKEQIEELIEQNGKYKKDIVTLNGLVEKFQSEIYQHQVDQEAMRHETFMVKESVKAIKRDLLAQQDMCKTLQEERSKLKDECQTLINSWHSLAEHIRQKVEEVAAAQATDMESSTQLFQQVLSHAREDLQELMVEDGKLSQEVERIKQENKQLRGIIRKEQALRTKAEDLLRRSSENNQDILNSMTDQRFWSARRRETS